ncbi:MAG: response regulator [Candidatus Latescibacteria bacterium]|nr:response regulator [Candidatus Latescibacterota bacterium]
METAADRVEAVARASEEAYDLILMDCAMPELDGIQATQRIRALAGPRGRVPIVALTALASQSDREFCLSHGMDGYIVKPFSLGALRETLARLTAPATLDEPLPTGELGPSCVGLADPTPPSLTTEVPMRPLAVFALLVLLFVPRLACADTVDDTLTTNEVMAFGINTYLVFLEVSELTAQPPRLLLAAAGGSPAPRRWPSRTTTAASSVPSSRGWRRRTWCWGRAGRAEPPSAGGARPVLQPAPGRVCHRSPVHRAVLRGVSWPACCSPTGTPPKPTNAPPACARPATTSP